MKTEIRNGFKWLIAENREDKNELQKIINSLKQSGINHTFIFREDENDVEELCAHHRCEHC